MKNNNYTEIDVSDFGARELSLMKDLLDSYLNNNRTTRLDTVTKVGFNKNSGNVFLIDDNYGVAMAHTDGALHDFLSCPECGNEWLDTQDPDDIPVKECCNLFHKGEA